MIELGHAETVGGGEPREIAKSNFDLLTKNLRLHPDMQILDFGCGCGRVALPILDYLSAQGKYTGIDIIPELIKFCVDEISSKFANAEFIYLLKTNQFYESEIGASSRLNHRIQELSELGEERFDFIIAFSVFTHLCRADAENYLKQLTKLLKPNGHLLLSTFLINSSSKKYISQNTAIPTFRLFPLVNPSVYYSDRTNKLAAVAFWESYLIDTAIEAGLDPVIVEYGNWCGRHAPNSYQDIVVFRRVVNLLEGIKA